VEVTRLRWSYDAGAAVTSPALLGDGTPVVGVDGTTNQLRSVNAANGTEKWKATLAKTGETSGQPATTAPSVGTQAIWVGSGDGRVYAVKPADGSLWGYCPAGAADAGMVFTPAVGKGIPEVAYAGNANGNILISTMPNGASHFKCDSKSSDHPIVAAPVLGKLGNTAYLYAGTADPGSPNTSYVEIFAIDSHDPTLLSHDAFNGPIHDDVPGPLAVRAGLAVALSATGSKGGIDFLNWTGSAFSYNPEVALTTAIPTTMALASGAVFAGTRASGIYSFDLGGSAWSLVPLASLSGAVTGLALGTGNTIYAVTSSGSVYALDGSGTTLWSRALGASQLDFPNIAPAASTNALPTLYAGSQEGKLYAVVVDADLDPSAPWPEAHHDPQNTGSAVP